MPEKLVDIVKFDEKGLVPVIVQDFYNDQVLMLAYANKEAIEKTLQTGYAHYYSRSRKKLWKKGETSGHTQKVKQIFYDCDSDTLLIKVEQRGAACHTNHRSCFYREYFRGLTKEVEPVLKKEFNEVIYKPKTDSENTLRVLYDTLTERKKTLPENSYTASLFKKGTDKIAKKIGEEAAEVIIALKNANESEIVYESADLLFHLLVALADNGIPPEAVMKELQRRMGISGKTEKDTRSSG